MIHLDRARALEPLERTVVGPSRATRHVPNRGMSAVSIPVAGVAFVASAALSRYARTGSDERGPIDRNRREVRR